MFISKKKLDRIEQRFEDLHERINALQKENDKYFNEKTSGFWLSGSGGLRLGEDDGNGLFYKLLDYLGIEYRIEEGFMKKKKKPLTKV